MKDMSFIQDGANDIAAEEDNAQNLCKKATHLVFVWRRGGTVGGRRDLRLYAVEVYS